MTQKRFWEYDERERVFIQHFGRCVAHVWQDANGQWDVKIESGRRHALRNGFISRAEAQAWVDEQAEDVTAADRPFGSRMS